MPQDTRATLKEAVPQLSFPLVRGVEVCIKLAAEANHDTHGHTHACANGHTTLTSSPWVQPQIPEAALSSSLGEIPTNHLPHPHLCGGAYRARERGQSQMSHWKHFPARL